MNLNGKRVTLDRLAGELTTAGVAHRQLGQDGDDLHTYDAAGISTDLPAAAGAVIAAHVADPVMSLIPALSYGTDVPPDYPTQMQAAIDGLRAYLGLATPTLAQSAQALKATIRLVLFLAWRTL